MPHVTFTYNLENNALYCSHYHSFGGNRIIKYRLGIFYSEIYSCAILFIIFQHGMGYSSIMILLHEVIKLLHYAGVKNPIIFRVGTSGGMTVPNGTVVISSEVVNDFLEPICYAVGNIYYHLFKYLIFGVKLLVNQAGKVRPTPPAK